MKGRVLLPALLLSIPAGVHASPDSAATVAWRNPAAAMGLPGPWLHMGLDVHSNRVVRGVPLFHRPTEVLLAQKAALVPELRVLPGEGLEVTWASAFALQDREGTRGEVLHADAAQEVRVRRPLRLDTNLMLLPTAATFLSWQRDGSLRGELSATLTWSPGPLDAEAQLLHHQALLGEAPGEVALTYGHVQLHRAFRPGRWLLLPLARASLEARLPAPTEHPAWTLQAGLLTAWGPEWLPVRLLLSVQAWYRGDLEAWTADGSLGLQGVFGGGG